MNIAGIVAGPSFWWFPTTAVPNWPKAMCKGKPPEWFDFHADDDQRDFGLKICRACPMALECRQWAEEHKETGLWGGQLFNEGKRRRAYRVKDK